MHALYECAFSPPNGEGVVSLQDCLGQGTINSLLDVVPRVSGGEGTGLGMSEDDRLTMIPTSFQSACGSQCLQRCHRGAHEASCPPVH